MMCISKIITGLLFLGLVQTIYAAPIQDNYELTDDVVNGALAGWELYKQGKAVCRYNGGAYADQNLEFGGNQFWSNGGYAKYDCDQNGHLETVFLVVGNDLEYFGSIGTKPMKLPWE